MSREEDILYFIQSGRIWPQNVEANLSHPFMIALIEVLQRLPNDIFEQVDDSVQFIIDSNKMLGVNVPFSRYVPIKGGNTTTEHQLLRIDTIVIFERSFALTHLALVGLLTHEIAHTFIDMKSHEDTEESTDQLVLKWGFEKELRQLKLEMKGIG